MRISFKLLLCLLAGLALPIAAMAQTPPPSDLLQQLPDLGAPAQAPPNPSQPNGAANANVSAADAREAAKLRREAARLAKEKKQAEREAKTAQRKADQDKKKAERQAKREARKKKAEEREAKRKERMTNSKIVPGGGLSSTTAGGNK
jgi:hypothetical protein